LLVLLLYGIILVLSFFSMNKLPLFIKNMILKNKYFRVFILLFFVAAIIIPWLVFGQGQERVDTGYRLNHGDKREVVHYTDSAHDKGSTDPATSSTCLFSASNNDYFVPTNTFKEWIAFATSSTFARVGVSAPVNSCECSTCNNDGVCNGLCETNANCSNDCPPVLACDTNPPNGFIGAAYTTNMTTGSIGGEGCNGSNAFGMTGYTVNFTPQSVIYNYPYGSSGPDNNTQWYSQCATLFKSPKMCNNDPCVRGVTYPDIYNANWFSHDPNKFFPNNATFYYGHYDATNHVCVYDGQIPQIVGGNPNVYAVGRVSILDETYSNQSGVISANRYPTVGSWGSNSTTNSTTNCGDTVCQSILGENSSTCFTDCGTPNGLCGGSYGGCVYNQACKNAACVNSTNCFSIPQGSCNANSNCNWVAPDGTHYGCYNKYNCNPDPMNQNDTSQKCSTAGGDCTFMGTCQ
jgi:hypothetical protein